MTKVRLVVIPGTETSCHDKVECAIRSDGSSPAADFWLSLKADVWPSEYAAYVHPDSDALHEFFQLVGLLEHLVQTGTPQYKDASKHLKEGIWEVRYSRIRMPYFDVDDDGENFPKLPIEDRRIVDPRNEDDWWSYPPMDPTIRLTHGFIKSGDRHPEEYDLAVQIRAEDLEND